jgi:hypothetical protein
MRGHCIVRQKMGDAEWHAPRRATFSNSSQNLWGMTLSGEATLEPQAQTELRPTCAGLPRHLPCKLALIGETLG